jgi:lysozyme family protein
VSLTGWLAKLRAPTPASDSDPIGRLIEREGGFVDHPADRGGPTNMGITLATLREMRPGATVDDVRALTPSSARAIYDLKYWGGPRIAELPPELAELVFDCAVLHGKRRAVQWLQQAVKAQVVDGVIGSATLAAARRADIAEARRYINRQRLGLVGLLVVADHSQLAFLRGWLTRIGEFL